MAMTPKPIILDFGNTKLFQMIQGNPKRFCRISSWEISRDQIPKIMERRVPTRTKLEIKNVESEKFPNAGI